MSLSLLVQAVDDAFALPGSHGTLAVARRAWAEYKAALAQQAQPLCKCGLGAHVHYAACPESAIIDRTVAAPQTEPEDAPCKRSFCSWSPPEGNAWCYTHSAELPYEETTCVKIKTQATRI